MLIITGGTSPLSLLPCSGAKILHHFRYLGSAQQKGRKDNIDQKERRPAKTDCIHSVSVGRPHRSEGRIEQADGIREGMDQHHDPYVPPAEIYGGEIDSHKTRYDGLRERTRKADP